MISFSIVPQSAIKYSTTFTLKRLSLSEQGGGNWSDLPLYEFLLKGFLLEWLQSVKTVNVAQELAIFKEPGLIEWWLVVPSQEAIHHDYRYRRRKLPKLTRKKRAVQSPISLFQHLRHDNRLEETPFVALSLNLLNLRIILRVLGPIDCLLGHPVMPRPMLCGIQHHGQQIQRQRVIRAIEDRHAFYC